jgi:tetratricopeptide (TPR) repeat protein
LGLLQSLTSAGVNSETSISRLTSEWSNVRSALRFALEERHDIDGGHWAVRKLWEFWMSTGRANEGWYWINRALQETDVASAQRAELLQRAAQIASIRQDFAALDALAKLLVEIHERSGDHEALGYALQLLANAKVGLGNGSEAELVLRRSLEQFRLADDQRGIALTLAGLGTIAGQQHLNYAGATQLLLHSLAIFRKLGVPHSCAWILGNLSVAAMRLGKYDEALEYGRESLSILQRLGNETDAGLQFLNIAEIYIEAGRVDEAPAALRSARQALGIKPNRLFLAYYFEAAFKLTFELGDYERAACLHGFAVRFRLIVGSPLQNNERVSIDNRFESLKQTLGTMKLERLAFKGAQMDQATAEGLIAAIGITPGQSSSSNA